MKQDKNSLEIKLLHENPNKLIVRYQYIIEATVSRFIHRGFFNVSEKTEIVQAVNLDLLDGKLDRIRQNFNGTVFLSTYFSKVVYNLCLEKIRKQRRKPQMVDEDLLLTQQATTEETDRELLISDELVRLEAILKSIPKRKHKLTVCLKLFSRTQLTKDDFLLSEKDDKAFTSINKVLEEFGADYSAYNDKMTYKAIVPYFNIIENKNSDADSLRKWFNMQLDKIITLLNGHPPVSAHSRESLRILFEYYFQRKNSMIFSASA